MKKYTIVGALIALLFIFQGTAAGDPSAWDAFRSAVWPKGTIVTLTANGTFTKDDIGDTGHRTLLIDPGGSARNYDPSGTFEAFTTVLIENTADAAETITFDSTGIAAAIAQDESAKFIYNGSAWENISPGTSAAATGVAEAYGSGWNSDTGLAQKNDVYDYLHNFDADDDGSYADETWYTALEVQLNNEAGLYAVLSDVTQFYEAGDKVGDADTLDTHDSTYFEVQLNNEAGLYAVLSDVSDFMQAADLTSTLGSAYDTEAELGALFNARCLESVFGDAKEADDFVLSGTTFTLVAEIPHTDVAETISANWEVQDDTNSSYGNDDDFSWAWDSAAARLEGRNSSDTPIFWFDLANSSFGVAAVADPETGLYDSGAAGAERTDEYAGGMGANMTDGTEDAEVSDFFFYYMNAGTKTTAVTVDGSENHVSFHKPIFLDDDTTLRMNATADDMDDHEYCGTTIYGLKAGEALTIFDTVFLKNDSDPVWEADATAASGEYPAIGIVIAAANDGAATEILTKGIIRDESWTGLTIGGAVYLGEADGTLTQTAPSTANDCVQIIGWAVSDSEIYFDFSRPYQLVE